MDHSHAYAGPALPPIGERDWPLPFVIKPVYEAATSS